MIFAGESSVKRIAELHKAKSNEVNTQIEADKAELEKLVGTSYLQTKALYNHDTVLSKWAISYDYTITGTCYVEEQIIGIPFTCTCTDAGELYLGTVRGYSTVPCKFEYTTTDGIVHVITREMGMVETVAAFSWGVIGLRIDQVVDHIRFVSDCFNPVQTLTYCYVFK